MNRHDHRTLLQSFDPQSNSLNALRIVFAMFVLFSHAISLGGFGRENIIGTVTLGDLGVDGFFGLSGYLIARSALRSSSMRRFAWHRFLRIYPGLWVCLLVTAFVIAPTAWSHENPFGTWSQFVGWQYGPVNYLVGNATASSLFGTHYFVFTTMPTVISGSPSGVATPFDWSGQLWTIEFELTCYLTIGILCFLRVLQRRWAVLMLALTVWGFSWINYADESAFHYDLVYWGQLLRLGSTFLFGSCVFLFSDKIWDSRWIAVLSAGAFVGGLVMNNSRNLDVVCGPALVYLTIWCGIHLPLDRVGRKNDLSYGIYIYAFPILQLLATFDINRFGYWPYALLSAGATVVVAAASWKLVEQWALRLKDWDGRFRRVVMALE